MKKNQFGFSLIGLLVAVSILSLVITGLTSFMQNVSKSETRIRQNLGMTTAITQIMEFLNNPDACANSFVDPIANPMTVFKIEPTANPTPIVPSGITFLKSKDVADTKQWYQVGVYDSAARITILSYELQYVQLHPNNPDGIERHDFLLRVNFLKGKTIASAKKKTIGGINKTEMVKMTVEFDPSNPGLPTTCATGNGLTLLDIPDPLPSLLPPVDCGTPTTLPCPPADENWEPYDAAGIFPAGIAYTGDKVKVGTDGGVASRNNFYAIGLGKQVSIGDQATRISYVASGSQQVHLGFSGDRSVLLANQAKDDTLYILPMRADGSYDDNKGPNAPGLGLWASGHITTNKNFHVSRSATDGNGNLFNMTIGIGEFGQMVDASVKEFGNDKNVYAFGWCDPAVCGTINGKDMPYIGVAMPGNPGVLFNFFGMYGNMKAAVGASGNIYAQTRDMNTILFGLGNYEDMLADANTWGVADTKVWALGRCANCINGRDVIGVTVPQDSKFIINGNDGSTNARGHLAATGAVVSFDHNIPGPKGIGLAIAAKKSDITTFGSTDPINLDMFGLYLEGNDKHANIKTTFPTGSNGVFHVTSDLHVNSDRNLKKEIAPLKDALSKLEQINGVSFKWKKNNKQSIGVIAQEIEAQYPQLVETDKDDGIKSVNYNGLVGVLIQTIKEQQKLILQNNKMIKQLQKTLIQSKQK